MKEFNEYIETNQWLKKLMDELSEEDGMRLEDSFYDFKQHCIKAENLPISDVSLRDKLAMSALTGLIANNKYFDPSGGHKTMILEEYIFERAYSMADGMMKARNGG